MKKAILICTAIFCCVTTLWFFRVDSAKLEIAPAGHTRFVFDLAYESSSQAPTSFTNMASAAPGTQHIAILLKADMIWTVLEQSHDSTEVILEIKPHALQSNDTANRIFPDGITTRLTIQKDGAISQILMPRDSFDGKSVIVTDILRHTLPRLARHEVKEGTSWSAEESTGINSKISTLWQANRMTSDTASLDKAYTSSRPNISVQKATYDIDRFTKFIRSVAIDMTIDSASPSGRAFSNLKLAAYLRESYKTDPGAVKNQVAGLKTSFEVSETLGNEALLRAQETLEQQKTLGSNTSETLKAHIKEADSRNKQANMELYSKIKALFILKPETASDFAFALVDYDRLDDRFSMVATALTASGSLEAQKVLREAIQGLDQDEAKKQRLIPNLSFMRYSSPESENFLRELAKQDASPVIRGTAHRALGTVAHNLRDSDPARTEAIFREYNEALSRASEQDQIVQNLDVLGNIGFLQQVETAERYIRDQNPVIRERAYNSLRHVQDTRAVGVLLTGLSSEQVDKIREVIAEALSYQLFQEEAIVTKVSTILYSEKNIAVAKHLLRCLAQNSGRFPAAVQVIEGYAKDCGHPDLCGYVTGLAQSLQPRP